MEAAGYFGKVPFERDYVFHGLSAPLTEIWSVRVAGWMQAGLQASGPALWQQHMLGSPVWRFVLPGFVLDAGATMVAGLMAGSIDGAGRLFPFTVLFLRPTSAGAVGGFDLVDRVLDGVEPPMLAYLDGHGDQGALAGAISQGRQALAQVVSDRAGGPGLLALDETAALLIQASPPWRRDTAKLIHALVSETAEAGGLTSEAVWWHDGLGQRVAAQCLVTRGVPAGAAAVPLFSPALPAAWQIRVPTAGVRP